MSALWCLGGCEQLLSRVLPDEEGTADVHVEGADDTLLGDLHTHIQQLDQLHRDPLLLVTEHTATLRISSTMGHMSTGPPSFSLLNTAQWATHPMHPIEEYQCVNKSYKFRHVKQCTWYNEIASVDARHQHRTRISSVATETIRKCMQLIQGEAATTLALSHFRIIPSTY